MISPIITNILHSVDKIGTTHKKDVLRIGFYQLFWLRKNDKNIHFLHCVLCIGLAVVHIKMINDVIFFIESILLNINCSAEGGRGVK